ncbi:MAG: hypothetical protein IPP48_00780 [Chitinophagaceae bacterium]|nr:hypothetical protein [Chitinophagaceae bacterium]
MRYSFAIIILAVVFFGCKKDKFTTAPQISFKYVKPDKYVRGNTDSVTIPHCTISVTDLEGDLGFIYNQDTSYIYIKNLENSLLDSVILPNIASITSKKFEADIVVFMKPYFPSLPSVKDTFYYEFYVKDFAKNKSNTVKSDPIYYFP